MLDAALLAAALNREAPLHTYGPNHEPVPAYAIMDNGSIDAFENRPGRIRPAGRSGDAHRRDEDRRGFVCADKDCKTVTPVYNVETPLEQEQGRLGNP